MLGVKCAWNLSPISEIYFRISISAALPEAGLWLPRERAAHDELANGAQQRVELGRRALVGFKHVLILDRRVRRRLTSVGHGRGNQPLPKSADPRSWPRESSDVVGKNVEARACVRARALHKAEGMERAGGQEQSCGCIRDAVTGNRFEPKGR